MGLGVNICVCFSIRSIKFYWSQGPSVLQCGSSQRLWIESAGFSPSSPIRRRRPGRPAPPQIHTRTTRSFRLAVLNPREPTHRRQSTGEKPGQCVSFPVKNQSLLVTFLFPFGVLVVALLLRFPTMNWHRLPWRTFRDLCRCRFSGHHGFTPISGVTLTTSTTRPPSTSWSGWVAYVKSFE